MGAERDDDESILARVEPHGLDPEAVTAYEVAVDLLNDVIAVYAARISEQGADPEAVASLRNEQASYVGARQRLRPGDREGVARIRQECATIIREFDRGSR